MHDEEVCLDYCPNVVFSACCRTILLSVISLLNEPNTSSPANVDASVIYRKWKESRGADDEYARIIRSVLGAWSRSVRGFASSESVTRLEQRSKNSASKPEKAWTISIYGRDVAAHEK